MVNKFFFKLRKDCQHLFGLSKLMEKELEIIKLYCEDGILFEINFKRFQIQLKKKLKYLITFLTRERLYNTDEFT